MKRLGTISFTTILLLISSIAIKAETLSVSHGSGMPGQTATLSVTLGENSTGVAGASFTLNYDTSALTLSQINSNYFPLFSQQGISPSSVIVDGTTYEGALVVNPTGTMLAAARATNGAAGDQIIFDLAFTINAGASDGEYSVQIVQSHIQNPEAGYTNLSPIPMLVGINGTSYPEKPVTSSTPGTITVSASGIVDSDGDGIDDGWEIAYFGDLVTANETSDFDHDGYIDFVEFQNDGTSDPLGTAYNPVVINAVGGQGYNSTRDISMGVDFNGDRYTDMLWLEPSTGMKIMWLMDGTLVDKVAGYPDSSYLNRNVQAHADFNGDGKSDILWNDPANGTKIIWLMDGSNVINIAGYGGAYTARDIEGIGDFNGDGKADILWVDQNSRVKIIWLMDGTNVTAAYAYDDPTYLARNIEALGDFNGDGKSDLLWVDPDSGVKLIWLMDGAAYTQIAGYAGAYTSRNIEGLGDFNGDGKTDLLWVDPSNGIKILWLMDGVTVDQAAGYGSNYVNRDIINLGDFNGDGKSDILWNDPISKTWIIWLMDGLSISSVAGTADAAYQERIIKGFGDFNGDRKTDILWVDPPSGSKIIWLMDGYSVNQIVGYGAPYSTREVIVP